MNIHGYSDDCEEMDYEEMSYMGNYLSQESMTGYNEIKDRNLWVLNL